MKQTGRWGEGGVRGHKNIMCSLIWRLWTAVASSTSSSTSVRWDDWLFFHQKINLILLTNNICFVFNLIDVPFSHSVRFLPAVRADKLGRCRSQCIAELDPLHMEVFLQGFFNLIPLFSFSDILHRAADKLVWCRSLCTAELVPLHMEAKIFCRILSSSCKKGPIE